MSAVDDNRELRNALGQFPTGVAIVTALDDDSRPVGMTINSLASISLSPALICWSIDRRAASYDTFVNASRFAVTVLSEHQAELALRFSTRGANKFENLEVDGSDATVIPNGCAWFKCDSYRSIRLGDHSMLVGKVTEFGQDRIPPLLFNGGQFRQLAQTRETLTRVAA
jgi:flavin reductase (DIM6/NTAB) family NADH-FMN oxidoreductase RutF